MDKNKNFIMFVICTSIMVATLSLAVYWPLFSKRVDGGFLLFIFPIMIVILNLILSLKYKIKFYEYILSVYVGFLLSVVRMSVIVYLERPKKLSPSERILHADADFMFVFIIFIIQAFVLLLLNLAAFAVYRLYNLLISKRLVK